MLIVEDILEYGLPVQSLGFRSPEVCCGDAYFTKNIDSWALGCSLSELCLGRQLFQVNSNSTNIFEIFRFTGTPQGPEWEALPLFPRHQGKFERQLELQCYFKPFWNGPTARKNLEIFDGLLQVDPNSRWSPQMAQDRCFGQAPPDVVVNLANGGRGLFTMIQSKVEDTLLLWMQGDPAWHEMLAQARSEHSDSLSNCVASSTEPWKLEWGGFVSYQPPHTPTCNNVDCSEPFFASTVYGFGWALQKTNARWLKELTMEVRAALRVIPQDQLGENGRRFFDTCFSQTGFAYAWVQVMGAEERQDPEHWDGGAGLLFAGLTLYGRRGLKLHLDGAWLPSAVEMQPASFYVANMASTYHQVVHYDDAGPLYHDADGDAQGDAGSTGLQPENVKLVILFRSDVFPATHARTRSTKPAPGPVFDIVNGVVARKLAREPLFVPTTAHAMECWSRACDRGLFQKADGDAPASSSGKRRRLTKKTIQSIQWQ